MSVTDSLVRRFLNQAQVISKTTLAADAFHLTIQGQDLINLNYIPGQHLRVFIGMGVNTSFGDKVRTYSVWHYDRQQGILQLAVCAHTDGPGSHWIKSIVPDQHVYLASPKGKFVVDTSASLYFFIGDASALAHLYEIRRNLSPDASFRGIIYAPRIDQLFPDLDGSYPFDFFELPENPLEVLTSLIEKEQQGNSQDAIAYIGGDGRVCVGLNRYFKEKGWSSKRIKTKPFWMPGKQGLE